MKRAASAEGVEPAPAARRGTDDMECTSQGPYRRASDGRGGSHYERGPIDIRSLLVTRERFGARDLAEWKRFRGDTYPLAVTLAWWIDARSRPSRAPESPGSVAGRGARRLGVAQL